MNPVTDIGDIDDFAAQLESQKFFILSRGPDPIILEYRNGLGWTGALTRSRSGGVILFGLAQEDYPAWRGGSYLSYRGLRLRRLHHLALRDGPFCCYCNKQMTVDDATVEHWLAMSLGGPDVLENMAVAHLLCNREADSLSVSEKIALRDRMQTVFEVVDGPTINHPSAFRSFNGHANLQESVGGESSLSDDDHRQV